MRYAEGKETEESHAETQENSYNPDSQSQQTNRIKNWGDEKDGAAYPM